MLAPQLGSGVYVLMLDPDHVGTSVPVLLVWLLLDRAPRRWYVPLAVTALLTRAQVADRHGHDHRRAAAPGRPGWCRPC